MSLGPQVDAVQQAFDVVKVRVHTATPHFSNEEGLALGQPGGLVIKEEDVPLSHSVAVWKRRTRAFLKMRTYERKDTRQLSVFRNEMPVMELTWGDEIDSGHHSKVGVRGPKNKFSSCEPRKNVL